MSKNAEGWIRHRGGECPVKVGVKVDYRMRNGSIDDFGRKPETLDWAHYSEIGDIMAYKLHKPAEQGVNMDALYATADAFGDSHADVMESVLSRLDGPLQWRDRIAEIDVEVQARTVERAELVQKLASEGFALIGRINELLTDAAQKHEDMSDWRNWKVGDLIEIVSVEDAEICASYYDSGALVKIEYVEREKYKGTMPVKIIDSDGDYVWPELAGIKWHSRPST